MSAFSYTFFKTKLLNNLPIILKKETSKEEMEIWISEQAAQDVH